MVDESHLHAGHAGSPGTGESHFRVSIAQGQALMRALRAQVSGLAMPAYVLDLPGARGKIPVGPAYLEGPGPDYVATDPSGVRAAHIDRI